MRTFDSAKRPSLLVSVRSAGEARAALLGGVDWIDVKEPREGPLGRARPEQWSGISQAIRGVVPVSVALGEIGECDRWPRAGDPVWRGLAARKVGLAGCDGASARSALIQVIEAWGVEIPWILVGYADWRRARAPHPETVLEIAASAGCGGVLLDTWCKTGNALDPARWAAWIMRGKALGLIVALAGGLDVRGVAVAARIAPDLIGVRGAACRRGDRDGAIDSRRVASLIAAVQLELSGNHPLASSCHSSRGDSESARMAT
jgi:uncharacterized protein (UPF0264 family)